MDLAADRRAVLTLDAGGTNFVFGAMRGGADAVEAVRLPSRADDLGLCLGTLVEGFSRVREALEGEPAAISFAFPGPADYPAGVIGDLGNLPCFRGGVPLGPMLSARFGLPVFINNDGDLFAYGEAIGGLLPQVNRALEKKGSPKRYRNLFGVTLGTGFGGGLVHDGRLFLGDNAAGAEIWCSRSGVNPAAIAEEGASIRAVRRAYAHHAGVPLEQVPEPADLFLAATGSGKGNGDAARKAFQDLGRAVGDALASAVAILDGLVVVGGGLSGAASLFLQDVVDEMNRPLAGPGGAPVPRLESVAYNLEDPEQWKRFVQGDPRRVPVPGTDGAVLHDPGKRVGVGLSSLGTSRAISLGAYAFALAELDLRARG